MRVLLCGGGTAGHINPALAIARKLQAEMPDIEIAFVGTPAGLENRLIPAAGFELYHVVVSGFKREFKLKNVSHNVRAAFYAVKSPHDANRILKEFKPDLVVGTGGYVSWPVLKAAAKQKIPTAIHEQNAMPGLTTRMLSKLVDLVFISYQESEKHFDCPADKLVLTGNPLRPELRTVEKSAERKRLGISEKERSVLAFGGSLGAKYVNYALFDWEKTLTGAERIRVTHALGRRGYEAIKDELPAMGLADRPYLEIKDYIDDMPSRMAAADLVICRAGALTLSELAFLGKPAILIPSPYVADDHQLKNARVFEAGGAALVVEEKDLAEGKLIEAIRTVIDDREKLESMSRAMARFAVRDAEDRIFIGLESLLRR